MHSLHGRVVAERTHVGTLGGATALALVDPPHHTCGSCVTAFIPAFIPVQRGAVLRPGGTLPIATSRLACPYPSAFLKMRFQQSQGEMPEGGGRGVARRPGAVVRIKRASVGRRALNPRPTCSRELPAPRSSLPSTSGHTNWTQWQEGREDNVAREAGACVNEVGSEMIEIVSSPTKHLGRAADIAQERALSANASCSVDAGANEVHLSGQELDDQITNLRQILQRRPLLVGDEVRIASGELQPREMWSTGPKVVFQELLRATLLLAVVVKKTFILAAQVAVLALRTAGWLLEWVTRVGDAKEWWVPDAVDFTEHALANSKHSRAMPYLRLLRAKLRTAVLVICRTVGSALSPEVLATGEKWVKELLLVVSEQTRAHFNTTQPASTKSGAANTQTLEDVADDRLRSVSGIATGDVGSSVDYSSRLDMARDRHNMRLTNSIMGVDVSSGGLENVTIAHLDDRELDATDGLDAAARGYVSLMADSKVFEKNYANGPAKKVGSTKTLASHGTRTRKRDATMKVVNNLTSSVGTTFEQALANIRGISKAVNVSSLEASSYNVALEALSAMQIPTEASVNASLALWTKAEGSWNQTGSWMTSVLSGGHADASAWVEKVEGVISPWSGKVEGWWAGVESSVEKWDSGLVHLVDKAGGGLGRVFSSTVDSATALPMYQSAEQWIRGNEFSWGWYIKVQRWWHQWILFCTPKWESFESWARSAKMPEFARRVMSNVIFYRVSYLRWLCGLAAAELVIWQKASALLLVVTSLLSAMVVRSNVLALSALKAREASRSGSGFRGAYTAGVLKPLFGIAAEEQKVEEQQKDKSQLAAGIAALALVWGLVSPSNVVRNVFFIIFAHALLHAKQVHCPAQLCSHSCPIVAWSGKGCYGLDR